MKRGVKVLSRDVPLRRAEFLDDSDELATPDLSDDNDEEQPKQNIFQDGDWKITVKTESAAKNGHVVMVIYGNRENSVRVVLNPEGRNDVFLNDSEDTFKINLKGFGKITKIRMELVPKSPGRSPQWKLREVRLQNMKTLELLRFKFNCLLSRQKGKRELMAELPAVRPRKKVLSVVGYHVEVYTCNEPGADTDANVYLTLFGGLGDTGKRLLQDSDKPDKFQQGQVDIFTLEAVTLGSLKRCIVSCDGKGPGEGWKCEKIIVKENPHSHKEFCFPCKRWLDRGVDDGRCARLLKARRVKVQAEFDNGRQTFFHRLTGNKPNVVQLVASDSEDSDPGFYKRHRRNMGNILNAEYLSDNDDSVEENDQTSDNDADEEIKSEADYSFLPKIESARPKPQHEPKPKVKSERNTVKFPAIEQTSLIRKKLPKRLEDGKAVRQKQKEIPSSNTSKKYPWESEKTRRIIEEAHRIRAKYDKNIKPDVDLGRLDINQDSDKESVESQSKRQEVQNYKISERSKARESDIETNKANQDKHISSGFDPPQAKYLGSKKKVETPKDDRNSGIKKTDDKHTEVPRKTSQNASRLSHHRSRKPTPRYFPRTKKGGFPWENRDSIVDKPKTALVRPTQREDLNKLHKEELEKKKSQQKGNTMAKYENVNSHFPSRIELRLMARRLRVLKQQAEMSSTEDVAKHPKPMVRSSLFVGHGSIEERLEKRREREKHRQNQKQKKVFDYRRPDNLRKSIGKMRTEERMAKKKKEQQQKEEERQRLIQKEREMAKPKFPVFMPPVQKEKVVTYGENYQSKKAAMMQSSQQNTRQNTHGAASKQSYYTNSYKPNIDHSRSASKQSNYGAKFKSRRESPVKKGGAGMIDSQDDDIWDYFASVVDDLKVIEIKQQKEEENKVTHQIPAFLNQT